MKNIIILAFTTFSLNVWAQQNKIQQQINKTNLDLNHLNNQLNQGNQTINGTATDVNQSIKTVSGATKTFKDIFNSVKAGVQVTAQPETKQIADNQKTENQQTTDRPSAEINKDSGSPAVTQNGKTTITISNCNFATLKELITGLGANTSISKVEKSLTNGTAQLMLQHSGTTDDITFFIDSTFKNLFDILGFNDGAIMLTVKL